MDYATIRAIKPDIVYASISGLRRDRARTSAGPARTCCCRRMGGALYSAGQQDQPPQAAPYFLVDAITAYSAFEGVLAALLHRERTGAGPAGPGEHARCADRHADAGAHHPHRRRRAAAARSADPRALATSGRRTASSRPPTATCRWPSPTWPCWPRRWTPRSSAQWDAEADGFTQRDAISAIVAERLRAEPTEHWLDVLGERGVWVGPVYSYDDLLDDPQVQHNGSFVTLRAPDRGHRSPRPGFAFAMSATPPAVDPARADRRPAHASRCWPSAGLPGDEIDRLLADGVIGAR